MTFNPLPTDTSLYMIGDVSVSVILPESDASSPNTEDWTQEEIDQVTAEIMNGLDWWKNNNLEAKLTFIYDWNYQVSIPKEPITMSGLDYWIIDTMDSLNYPYSGDWVADIYQFVNDKRASKASDWGFAIFVVDSSADPDGKFADGKFAFANLGGDGGGPYMVMTYDNENYEIENMDAVLAHETGHIFGAKDQYGGCYCTEFAGYLNFENQNCINSCTLSEPSIMKSILLPLESNVVDSTALGQLGLVDSDINGVLDIVDLANNELYNHTPDPETFGEIFDYSGYSDVDILNAPNINYNSVSINDIASVMYTMYLTDTPEEKLPWTEVNGIFGGPDVSYFFGVDTNGMSWGDWTFETKAITRFDEEVYHYDDLSIYGCEGGNLDPKQKGNVTSFDGAWNYEEDVCIGTTIFNSKVKQYSCDGYDIVSSETRCLYGCSGGKCLNKYIPQTRYYMMEAVVCEEGRDGRFCDNSGIIYGG